MAISWIRTNDGALAAHCGGKGYSVPRDHPRFAEVMEAVRDGDEARFVKMADIPRAVAAYSKGGAEVRDGRVLVDGREVHNVVCDRVLKFMGEGLPFEPLLKFLGNLLQNPSKRSVDQLYLYCEKHGLAITEDGCILAHKRVRQDWRDIHSGTVYYGPPEGWVAGTPFNRVVEVPRNSVDDDSESACSFGLHAGALGYVSTFGSGGHVIVVKINPRDVVSVPKDANCTKLRCCRLEVLYEYAGELPEALYSAAGKNYESGDDDGEDCDEGTCSECGGKIVGHECDCCDEEEEDDGECSHCGEDLIDCTCN